MYIVIMLILMFLGMICGIIGSSELLPGQKLKTPAWAWILVIIGTIMCVAGLYMLMKLSGVTIVNW